MKLTLYHRAETLRARYARSDPSIGPNRPHISSVIINVKERRDKTYRMRPNLTRRAPPALPLFFVVRLVAVPFPSGPSGAPSCASAPPVKGYLRIGRCTRNPFFQETSYFFRNSNFLFSFSALRAKKFAHPRLERFSSSGSRRLVSGANTRSWVIHMVTPKTVPNRS